MMNLDAATNLVLVSGTDHENDVDLARPPPMVIAANLVIACDRCRALGWIPGPTEWPIRCPDCVGRGRIPTLSALARRLDVPRWALERVVRGQTSRYSPIVLERILTIFPDALDEARGP